MRNVFDRHITCAFLYSITRYGYPPDAEHMVTYIHEMADLGFQSIELEGIGEAHLKTVYKYRKEIKQALEDRGVVLPVFCTVLPGIASPHEEIAQKNLDLFKIGCELGAYLGAKGVLDNGPLVPYEFPADMPIHRHYSPDVLRNVCLPLESILECFAVSDGYGLQICSRLWAELLYASLCRFFDGYNKRLSIIERRIRVGKSEIQF